MYGKSDEDQSADSASVADLNSNDELEDEDDVWKTGTIGDPMTVHADLELTGVDCADGLTAAGILIFQASCRILSGNWLVLAATG